MRCFRKDQENTDKVRGCDKSIILRFYGDSKRDAMNRYNRNTIPIQNGKVITFFGIKY